MNTQTIERGTITIQRIFPAKGPGRSATIKDVDGMMFGYFPDKLQGIFDVGNTYTIEFTEKVKEGTTYRDIVSGKMVQVQQQAQPAQRQATQAASAQPKGDGQYYRPTAPRDSERMFVCSTLNAFIQTGRVECHRDHLIAAIGELREAYATTFGQDDPR